MKSRMSAQVATILACKGGAFPLSPGVWGPSGKRTNQTEEAVGGCLCGEPDRANTLAHMTPGWQEGIT